MLRVCMQCIHVACVRARFSADLRALCVVITVTLPSCPDRNRLSRDMLVVAGGFLHTAEEAVPFFRWPVEEIGL